MIFDLFIGVWYFGFIVTTYIISTYENQSNIFTALVKLLSQHVLCNIQVNNKNKFAVVK